MGAKEMNFNKKGQITLFIIFAIVIFISLAIFFLARDVTVRLPTGTEFAPDQYMDSCIRRAVRDKIDVMIAQGGPINPTNYRLYNGTKSAYLCQNVNYYAPCINQYPRYLSFLDDEITSHIGGDIDACLNSLKDELEQRNYAVSMGGRGIEIELKPSLVEVRIPLNLTLRKNEVAQVIPEFKTIVRTPLYDLGWVAREIVAQEAQYCYFEYVGYMLLYPSIDVRIKTLSDATKLYSVTHVPTRKQLHFAVRGCAFPAGV